jgi:hypothetical protein
MATLAQIAANRANAKNSTGPRTIEGKARSARNGVRHGFRSQTVLITGDDPAEYNAMLDELTDHFVPSGLTETRAVREMADAEWRLRRVRAYQEKMLSIQIEDLKPLNPYAAVDHYQAGAYNALIRDTCFVHFLRYEAKFERQYDRAYRTLLAARRPAVRATSPTALKGPRAVVAGRRRTAKLASLVPVPRNATCPCGSGLKFKRCCGKSAPPALSTRS